MTTAVSEYLAVNFFGVRETVMNMESYGVVPMVRVSSFAVLRCFFRGAGGVYD